ncbi:hypothetical protein QX51_07380 [Terrisporobacter othiniensis]|uniref:Uncharacterized protein n=1 Tax=Terrisporobacter othiniensis TaxID=1577792 RepID=A0A0B3VLJ0_9FIRM|nr:DUF1492 domain-containing protein [Terrisporobacter othiniensis]KHS57641.1 hypothetical protein QX51_07380 [Terrisporobacter othiniensis]
MKKDKYYKMTEEILKDYNYMLHVIELINLELEEETNIDHVDKLKYIKNKNEIIIKKINIAINNMSDDEYVLFESLYINKERPINIMCKMNISKSTYYDLKKKLIFKISEIIYPKCIRDMHESYLF